MEAEALLEALHEVERTQPARLPHSPTAAMRAKRVEPEFHPPSVVEKEMEATLHEDQTEALGHPGVPCYELPPGHTHRLPSRQQATGSPVLDDGRGHAGEVHGVYGSGGLACGAELVPNVLEGEFHGSDIAAHALSREK